MILILTLSDDPSFDPSDDPSDDPIGEPSNDLHAHCMGVQ